VARGPPRLARLRISAAGGRLGRSLARPSAWHGRCTEAAAKELSVAKAHAPETLVRNVFLLTLVGVVTEIFAMFVMPHVRF
jgi:hypothetical protein